MRGIKEVTQLQFTAWPNYGVAPPNALAQFVALAEKKFQVASLTAAAQQRPCSLLVHCSGGVGRSGSFLAIFSFLRRVRRAIAGAPSNAAAADALGDPAFAGLGPTVLHLRRTRHPWCVEGYQQYRLCYATLGIALETCNLQKQPGQ